ncbi:MAG TPA: hypothetical protein PKW29_10745, partial [Clostridia bacterium]|nr:hypothetical protein [Clostridia bacterium]
KRYASPFYPFTPIFSVEPLLSYRLGLPGERLASLARKEDSVKSTVFSHGAQLFASSALKAP